MRSREFINEAFSWKNKNKIYSLMIDTIGSGPFDGGCVVFAQALQLRYGGEIVVLVGHAQHSVKFIKPQAQHAVLKLNDTLIDADGAASPQALIDRFEKNEMAHAGGRVTGIRSIRSSDLSEAPRNIEVARKIAALLVSR